MISRSRVHWLASLCLVTVASVAIAAAIATRPDSSSSGTLLIPDQINFRSQDQNRWAIDFLAQRWGIPSDRIDMLVEDSEPWMRIVGVLDPDTLASARLSILNTNYKEGRNWATALTRQGVPHN